MAKKVFTLITLKGSYKIDEKDSPESEINYDVFSICTWVAVTYGCEKVLRSSNTANEKIVGFTNRQFDEDSIDLVISFEQSISDNFYEDLVSSDCKVRCDKSVQLKSQLNTTTDIYIEPENINIEIFFDKKSLTIREKEIFNKDEKKIHTSNAVLFNILSSKYSKWDNLASLRAHKKFKEEYLSNAAFIRSIIKTYDPEDSQASIYINEFKALL
jgi:hypothetical protein